MSNFYFTLVEYAQTTFSISSNFKYSVNFEFNGKNLIAIYKAFKLINTCLKSTVK